MFDCHHLAENPSKPENLRPTLLHKPKAAAKEEFWYLSGDKLGIHKFTLALDSLLYPVGNMSNSVA
jgi:hypothetical protein